MSKEYLKKLEIEIIRAGEIQLEWEQERRWLMCRVKEVTTDINIRFGEI